MPSSLASALPLPSLAIGAVVLVLCHLLLPHAAALSPSTDFPLNATSSPPAPVSSSPPLSAVAATGTLRFALVTDEAAWSARSIGAVELFPKPLSFVSVSTGRKVNLAANSFVLHGGSGAGNDVWASGDRGRSWQLIAGSTVDGEAASSPYDETSFTNLGSAAVVLDARSGTLYRIGGRESTTAESDAVWRSTNALSWVNAAENSPAPFDGQRFYAGAAANSKGDLILQGGTYNNFRAYRSDVWLSSTQGRTWRLQTDVAAFGQRGIGVLLSSQHDDRLGGADILYLVGGQNEKDNSNEVWTSMDNGVRWFPLTLHGPFAQRDAFNGAITRDGVLIISAGLADTDVGLNEQAINDVWVSLNGGYTWGQCVEDAEWSDRYLQFTALDETGFFYVMGGRTAESGRLTQLNDVWRSAISFVDIDAVARTCGVMPPSCGVGLRCFPTGDTVVAADGSFVSCAACPHQLVQPSPSSALWQPLLLAMFALLFVATLLALAVTLLRLRSAGGSAPVALPGALHSWWMKGSTASTTTIPLGTDSSTSYLGL